MIIIYVTTDIENKKSIKRIPTRPVINQTRLDYLEKTVKIKVKFKS